MQGNENDLREREQLWKEMFSKDIRQDAEHYELAKHLNATTHAVVEEFVYAPAARYLPEHGSLLDAGCGSGFFCEAFARAGHDVVGFDFSDELIEVARRRYPDLDLRQMDVYDCGSIGRKFDVIVCAGVIQSVFEPERAYEQMASLQDPGGHLSMCTKNQSFLGNVLTPILSRLLQEFQLPFNHYTLRRLSELGHSAGYDVVERRYVYMFPGVFSAMNRLFNRSDLLNALFFPLAVHVLVVHRKR